MSITNRKKNNFELYMYALNDFFKQIENAKIRLRKEKKLNINKYMKTVLMLQKKFILCI